MAERQLHGFKFEEFILHELNTTKQQYTSKWDAIVNNINYSIKCIGINNALELGSLKRFWFNNEPFKLIIGRWINNKEIVSIDTIVFTDNILKELKGQLTDSDILYITSCLTIENFPIGQHQKAREFFKNWKNQNKYKMGLLTLTGKVDSKNQRRWQCSINYTNYLKLFGDPSMNLTIDG